MKILIVNTSDIEGGAARAAYRLHQSLLMKNIDSQMLVMNKKSDDFTVLASASKADKALNKLKTIADSIPVQCYKEKTATPFSVSWVFSKKIIQEINRLNPDVVHLHWINAGMIRIEDLVKINAPIIWSLHDMWAFTGGCHYDEQCEAYKKNCGSCPVLNSNSVKDLSYKVFNRKQRAYSEIKNLAVIGVSKWLTKCADESKLFKDVKTVTLPNPIDTHKFNLFNKELSRELWGLPKNKKLILFGAMGSTSDPRKGFNELNDALHNIVRNDIACVIFGASKPKKPSTIKCEVFYVGTLSDDVSIISLYNAVDVMLVPSQQEAFGQTASESMACGTPVVAFGHTGLLDIIDHKKNGYLAEPLNTTDLADGIEWVLDNDNYSDLCSNARDKIVREFDSEVVSSKYIQLYKNTIKALVG